MQDEQRSCPSLWEGDKESAPALGFWEMYGHRCHGTRQQMNWLFKQVDKNQMGRFQKLFLAAAQRRGGERPEARILELNSWRQGWC